MKHESRGNIDFVLHDIRHPVAAVMRVRKKPRKNSPWGAITRAFFVTALIFIVGLGLYRTDTLSPIKNIQTLLAEPFTTNSNGNVELIGAPEGRLLLNLFGKFGNLLGTAVGLGENMGVLDERGFYLVLNDGGEELVGILQDIHGDLEKLNNLKLNLEEYLPGVNMPINADALDSLATLRDGLGSLISFIDVPEKRHIILLFEDQSKIRPSGGFIESYAKVTLDRGAISDIKVNDIYYTDSQLSLNIIPPLQLVHIISNWGARDASWFFDYPTSAEKTIQLLDASGVYASYSTVFDGAISVNMHVISDMLAVVGPIKLQKYDIMLTGENLIDKMRDRAGGLYDENKTQSQGQILGAMMPVMLDRLGKLSHSQTRDVTLLFLARMINKDIKFYLRDQELQEFVKEMGFAGDVYQLANDFNGDYLAVVNANVSGSQSDTFIDQSIALESLITSGGIVQNRLSVVHTYKEVSKQGLPNALRNQNFVKIFTPPNAKLVSVSGVMPRVLLPLVDYKILDYTTNPTLDIIEGTREVMDGFGVERYVEFGKNVFAMWPLDRSGNTNKIEINYTNRVKVYDGAKYKFVFDKQSGIESSLSYTIFAPPGYLWKESQSSRFVFKSEAVLSRTTINLTFIKDE